MRILILIISLLFINNGLAESYIGFNLGGNITSISKDINYSISESNLTDIASGFRGQVFLGYNIHWQNDYMYWKENNYDIYNNRDELFLALEIDGNYNSDNANSNISNWFLSHNASVSEQLRYSYDLFLLAKYHFPMNVIWFAGIGYTSAHLEVSTPAQTAGNLGITGSASEWLNGWSIKAGLEVAISKCFNIVTTYQYTKIKSLRENRTEPLSSENVSTTYNPTLNSVMIGFIYVLNSIF